MRKAVLVLAGVTALFALAGCNTTGNTTGSLGGAALIAGSFAGMTMLPTEDGAWNFSYQGGPMDDRSSVADSLILSVAKACRDQSREPSIVRDIEVMPGEDGRPLAILTARCV